jgi:hypothetical protein
LFKAAFPLESGGAPFPFEAMGYFLGAFARRHAQFGL